MMMGVAFFFMAACSSAFVHVGIPSWYDRSILRAESSSSSEKDAVAAAAATTAAGGIVAATTTVAGTACASGACAVGGAAAATAGGGAMAQMAALGAAGLTSLAVVFDPASSASGGDLASMRASSVELSVAVDNGKPSVLEFYSTNCPHCNQAAKNLYDLERRHSTDLNWVMVDTDVESNRLLWESLGVNEIPHFAFLDADENLKATAIGVIDASQAEQGIALAKAAS